MSRFTPRRRHVAVFAFLAVAWGGSFVGMKIGLDGGIPPILYAALRFDVGAAVLLPTVLFLTDGPRRPHGRDDWLYVLVAGAVIVTAANVFLFLGQQRTTSAVSSVVFSLNPVLAAGFAWLLLADEEPSPARVAGIVVGLVGVVVVANPSASSLDEQVTGVALLVCAACCIGFGSVLTRRLSPSLPSTAGTAWAMVFGAAALHGTSALLGESVAGVEPSTRLLVAVLYVGTVSTGFAYAAYFALLENLGAVRTNLVSYFVPLVSAVAAWTVRGEPVSATTAAGFVVVFAGFALVNWETISARFRTASA